MSVCRNPLRNIFAQQQGAGVPRARVRHQPSLRSPVRGQGDATQAGTQRQQGHQLVLGKPVSTLAPGDGQVTMAMLNVIPC